MAPNLIIIGNDRIVPLVVVWLHQTFLLSLPTSVTKDKKNRLTTRMVKNTAMQKNKNITLKITVIKILIKVVKNIVALNSRKNRKLKKQWSRIGERHHSSIHKTVCLTTQEIIF